MNDEIPPNQSLEKPEEQKDQDPDQPLTLEPEVLKKLPPEVRKLVEFSLQSFSAPVFHPITKKINEAHIDKLLDQSEADSTREFKDRTSSRRYSFAAFVVVCVLFVFLTYYLTTVDKDLYRDVVKVLIGLVGGFGGGFAFKGYLDRDKD
jgi:hypothetical protein